MCFVFLNGFTRIQKRIRTDSKTKHEVLDCSFEMLEPGCGGGAGVEWCYGSF